jgi:hypothetical protein
MHCIKLSNLKMFNEAFGISTICNQQHSGKKIPAIWEMLFKIWPIIICLNQMDYYTYEKHLYLAK